MKWLLLVGIILISSFAFLVDWGANYIYKIPSGYEGPVVVLFGFNRGTEKEYNGIQRVYNIPKDGILFTQFHQNYGIRLRRPEFFYTSANEGDEVKELKYVDQWQLSEFIHENLNSEEIVVFREGFGNVYVGDQDLEYQKIIVCKPRDFEQWENLFNSDKYSQLLLQKARAVDEQP